ncbi:putative Na+-dependent transporter [Bradyrhizobium japonicum]
MTTLVTARRRLRPDLLTAGILAALAGHTLRPFIGGWVGRHSQLLGLFDRGLILLVIYGAFGAAAVAVFGHGFRWATLMAAGIFSGMLLAVMLVAMIWGARCLGFSRQDEIAIAFRGSKKSLARGLPIAGGLFPSGTAGGLILPLVVFHQIQLAVRAVLAQRFSARAATIPEVAS